jgi:hypothetical protein
LRFSTNAGSTGSATWIGHRGADQLLRTRPPDALLHVDVKKLGNVPDGGELRYVCRRQGAQSMFATKACTGITTPTATPRSQGVRAHRAPRVEHRHSVGRSAVADQLVAGLAGVVGPCPRFAVT